MRAAIAGRWRWNPASCWRRSISRWLQNLTPKALDQKIRDLEAQMYTHAQNLEFEQAAALRDEIHQLREQFIAIS